MGFDDLTRKKDDPPLVARDKELRDAKEAARMAPRRQSGGTESLGSMDRGPQEKYTNPRKPGESFEDYRARLKGD